MFHEQQIKRMLVRAAKTFLSVILKFLEVAYISIEKNGF